MCWYYQRFLLCHAVKLQQFGAVTTSWFTTLYDVRMHDINPGIFKTHTVFLFTQCPWKILGLRILYDTAFRINIYSFENTIGSNINGCDTLKMECSEGIIVLHIVTRFWLIKWNTICVDILNIRISCGIICIQRIVTHPLQHQHQEKGVYKYIFVFISVNKHIFIH